MSSAEIKRLASIDCISTDRSVYAGPEDTYDRATTVHLGYPHLVNLRAHASLVCKHEGLRCMSGVTSA
jgi:hypothetical protein